ncbi:hypothetical protein [Actinobaculum suis]|uniref:hypothetical protein n=1 Tax=Actinobaculum suis TaxID=1657 RepID=UPI0008087077|nr:hypothetical protein [Actinobaculum suis]OCA96012.1 hypothetical protein ACU20_03040 [Actinobaculum suis]OCA96131.1 hypothetical protein ACU21_02195 [Actinobaculum suis]
MRAYTKPYLEMREKEQHDFSFDNLYQPTAIADTVSNPAASWEKAKASGRFYERPAGPGASVISPEQKKVSYENQLKVERTVDLLSGQEVSANNPNARGQNLASARANLAAATAKADAAKSALESAKAELAQKQAEVDSAKAELDRLTHGEGAASASENPEDAPGANAGDGEKASVWTDAASQNGALYVNSWDKERADRTVNYGKPQDEIIFGDWNGDGVDTPMVRRGNTFLGTNRFSGLSQFQFTYGVPGDTILVGDWNGNGKDTIAVVRDNKVYVRNSLTTGVADKVYAYGNPDDTLVAGDWDGSGRSPPLIVDRRQM